MTCFLRQIPCPCISHRLSPAIRASQPLECFQVTFMLTRNLTTKIFRQIIALVPWYFNMLTLMNVCSLIMQYDDHWRSEGSIPELGICLLEIVNSPLRKPSHAHYTAWAVSEPARMSSWCWTENALPHGLLGLVTKIAAVFSSISDSSCSRSIDQSFSGCRTSVLLLNIILKTR